MAAASFAFTSSFMIHPSVLPRRIAVGFIDWLGGIRFHSGRCTHKMRSQVKTYFNDWPSDTSGGVDNTR